MHDVALVLLHVSLVLLPERTRVGEAEMVTVGTALEHDTFVGAVSHDPFEHQYVADPVYPAVVLYTTAELPPACSEKDAFVEQVFPPLCQVTTPV